MLIEDVKKQISTPLGAPAYPKGPYLFRNREYLNIVYRTDMDSLKKVVPEPLEIEDPLVKFEIMYMPDVTGLGAYTECGQVIPITFNNEKGEYLHAMYVDNHPAIALGREASAYPKKLGAPKLYIDSDTLVGTLDYGSLRVANATMGYKHQPMDIKLAREELTRPTFMLKIVPDFNGKQKVCELVRTDISELTIHGAWTGPARLQLFEHVLAPMADLPVLEIVHVSHILTDLKLAAPTVAYDYLAKDKVGTNS
ncbi:acetoacetate decarboxylase [Neobacillus cucumis]|uniref:Acetoacetate decarboxylase n=1 Tax=Neobacillus cucumis TaxID=1740721 RepID=A0A2N5HDR1_9BACI|nr:acetoacetate decarboxylase [Neobacillus cucumis]PLS03654.1 acetoacetate decarboxylase [Neobacillus cucumis]